jgi:hypothetical protein
MELPLVPKAVRFLHLLDGLLTHTVPSAAAVLLSSMEAVGAKPEDGLLGVELTGWWGLGLDRR